MAHTEPALSPVTAAARRLHVLTLTPFFPSAGDEVSGCFIAESNRHLGQFGIASSVIAVAPLYYSRRDAHPAAPATWMRYLQIPSNLGLSSAGSFLFARLLAALPGLIKHGPIDLIHAHAALPCGHAAALLSRRLKIPFVVTLHGLDVFNTCFLSGLPTRWRRQASINTYRAARTVICISREVKRLLLDGMPGPVHTAVVYNGTDTGFFSPASSEASRPNAHEILVVGNLLVGKGHELVLRAISRLETSFPDLRCRIIGAGPDRPRFEALVRELGIATRVQFEGRKTRAEVAEAMRACSVFVLPSRCEALGCVYLEAMACAKPVIACSGMGIAEIIEHQKNGWLIPVDGLDELAQGLSSLLQSPDLRSRLGSSARATVANGLTLSHQAQRLAEIYREGIA